MKRALEKIKIFFDNFKVNHQYYRLVIIRGDGIPLYASMEKDKNSIGALVGGVWHASRELNKFVPGAANRPEDEFRFSFDTSETGVYILPLKYASTEMYMAFIFWDQVNPGQFKMRAREIRDRLESYLTKDIATPNSKTSEEKRPGYLFENISDDEMDKLFIFSGNN